MEYIGVRKFSVITTFNDAGYERYGRSFISGFEQYWPVCYDLFVYFEGNNPEQNHQKRNIKFLDLYEECPNLVEFKARHKDDPIPNGELGPSPKGLSRPKQQPAKHRNLAKTFLWDAVRFSHKSYCVVNAGKKLDCDVMIWLDADVRTFRSVPEDFFENLIKPEVYCAFLGRQQKFTETGFVSYNLKHPCHLEFINRVEDFYNNDRIFDLLQWHDCEVFDTVRKQMVEEGKVLEQNLSSNHRGEGHPFINCELGRYFDHLKGPRKDTGTSRQNEIKNNLDIDYWKKVKSGKK